MPISGIGSWLPTIDAFVTHWTSVNTAISPTVLTLTGGYLVGTLETDRDDLNDLISSVQTAQNAQQNASGVRDVNRAILKPRMVQFNFAVKGILPGTQYVRSLPKVISFQDAPGKWRDAMDDVASLWTTINANTPAVTGFTPPLKLAAAFTLANFNTAKAILDSAFITLAANEQLLAQARDLRDTKFAGIYQRLKQYRNAVLALLPTDSALLDSIPRLTPLPGSTPAAVSLSATWNEDTKMADLVWSASADPNFDHYEIRYHPGPKYKASEEQMVDSTNDTEFATDYGLPANGSVAWFKVYVVTTTSNEKGSNAVKVIRTSD